MKLVLIPTRSEAEVDSSWASLCVNNDVVSNYSQLTGYSMDEIEGRTRGVFADDEVLDFPGLPGEEGNMQTTNGVSVDAYLALKSAFKEMKDRFLDSEQRCGELLKRLKRKESKDSVALEQVHQLERDELLEKLKKSYAAFQEKYAENEELQKKVDEMEAEIERLTKESKVKKEENEALAGEITEISKHFHEQKNEVKQLRIRQAQVSNSDSEKRTVPKVVDNYSQTLSSSEEMLTLDKFLNKMEDYGLQVVERWETLIIWVVDKGKLKTFVAECADKNAANVFEKFLLGENSINNETGRLYSSEEFNLLSKKHTEEMGKVFLLKQKIVDQAQEICRLRKWSSDVIQQHSECNKEKQKTLERETKELQRNLEEGALSKDQNAGGVAQVKTEMVGKRFGDMLRKVVAIIEKLNELHKELDSQARCVQRLIDKTETSTHTLSTKMRERYQNTERQFPTEDPDRLLGHLHTEDDARYLSFPVQETEARTTGASAEEIPCSTGGASGEEAGKISVVEELSPRPVEDKPPLSGLQGRAPSGVEGASPRGRDLPRRHKESSETYRSQGGLIDGLRPSFVHAERAEWTEESDIEVIEENDPLLGATSMRGNLCPICESYFPGVRTQDEFERHVMSHFEDE